MIRAGQTPGTIRATFAGAAVTAGATRRTVAGVAVPWDVEGTVSTGQTVVFHPGSLDAGARPVLLRDHDLTRPIGTVVDAHDDGTQMHAVGRISAVPDGDHALVLAADGALSMFSVGADPTEFDVDAGGIVHVYAADWRELSLLSQGAYTDARVATVTASHERPDPMNPDPTLDLDDVDPLDAPLATDAPDDPPDDDDDDTPPAPTVETLARPVPITAARRHPSAGRQQSPFAGLTLSGLAAQITAGQHDPRAAQYAAAALRAQGALGSGIQAALADITLVGTNNVGALQRPGYQAELIEIIGWGTPLIDALRQGDLQRGDFPNKTFNRWTTTPTVGLQATEKAEITSTVVNITPASCSVATWAGGNDISQQTLDLGSPSFVEDYIRAAAMDYAKKTDTYAVTTLLAAATAVTTLAGDSFIQVMAKLIGALSPATTPPGGLFMAMSYDVGVGLISVTQANAPAFWDGTVNFGSFTPSVTAGGLTAFVDPNLPAKTYLAGHRQGATWYDLPGTPFNLRAINVPQLGLDVAVYGYGALGVQYPGAFTKTTQP